MKTKHLSPEACRNHLGLNNQDIRMIDDMLDSIGGISKSLFVRYFANGNVGWEPDDNQIKFNRKMSPCLRILYEGAYGSDDPADVFEVVAPWIAIRKGAPHKGHCVYNILTSSPSNTFALRMNPENDSDKKAWVPMYPGKSFGKEKQGRTLVYVGKTSNGVFNRFKQHMYSMASGSMTQFYQIMRGLPGYQPQLPIGLTLVSQFENEGEAYNEEEIQIAEISQYEDFALLNTIGSRAAFSELVKKFPGERETSPELAEQRLLELSNRTASNWNNPEFAESVICNNPRNFDKFDISTIRLLNKLKVSPSEIAKRFDVPVRRINGVIDARTYARII